MRKKTKLLQRQNNQREKDIIPVSRNIYTQMIVYLRGSELSVLSQEEVRGDLIGMILDGQTRGDSIETVLGGDYKSVCDAIIDGMPKKSQKAKILDMIDTTLTAVWVLSIIGVAVAIVDQFAGIGRNWIMNITAGDIINLLMIILLANIVVQIICRGVFIPGYGGMLISVLMVLLCMVAVGVMVAIGLFFKITLFSIPILLGIIVTAVLFTVEKILAANID